MEITSLIFYKWNNNKKLFLLILYKYIIERKSLISFKFLIFYLVDDKLN